MWPWPWPSAYGRIRKIVLKVSTEVFRILFVFLHQRFGECLDKYRASGYLLFSFYWTGLHTVCVTISYIFVGVAMYRITGNF